MESSAIAQPNFKEITPACDPLKQKIKALEEQINQREEFCSSIEDIQQRKQCFAGIGQLRKALRETEETLQNCLTGLPAAGIYQVRGRVTFLRVNDGGFGPPNDFLDAEVIFKLSTLPDNRAFGFQLRNDNSQPARQAMFSLLETALVNGLEVVVDYSQVNNRFNNIAFRIVLVPNSESVVLSPTTLIQ